METNLENLKKALRVRAWSYSSCSICGSSLIYFMEGDNIFCDTNCDCVNYYSEPRIVADHELKEMLIEKNGWIPTISKFITETLGG